MEKVLFIVEENELFIPQHTIQPYSKKGGLPGKSKNVMKPLIILFNDN